MFFLNISTLLKKLLDRFFSFFLNLGLGMVQLKYRMVKRLKFSFLRLKDCSLFIGSTGPVFCGKDPWKKFLSRQQKFPKKLVSRQWKEGKSPCPV